MKSRTRTKPSVASANKLLYASRTRYLKYAAACDVNHPSTSSSKSGNGKVKKAAIQAGKDNSAVFPNLEGCGLEMRTIVALKPEASTEGLHQEYAISLK